MLSEMKIQIFVVAFILIVPAGIFLAMTFHRIRDYVFMLLVIGTCQPYSLFGFPADLNLRSLEWYRGSTRGFEISYLDMLALILIFSSILSRQREGIRLFWPPSLGILLLFFAWCAFDVIGFSEPKIFGLFELTKLLRAILLFVGVAFYLRGPSELRNFLWALIITIGFEAIVCLSDRYLFHYHRVRGTTGHPNALATYCVLIAPLFITTLFASDTSPWLRRASAVAYLCATGCTLLTISRTGFAAIMVVTILAYFYSNGVGLSPRNIAITVLGLIVLFAMVAKSYNTLASRFEGTNLEREYLTEEGDRGTYFRIGIPAIRNGPVFGMGLNNWSYWVANKYGALAGIPQIPYPGGTHPPTINAATGKVEKAGAAPAHNLYLLTAGEVGIPGLILYLALFIRWLTMNGSVVLLRRDDLIANTRAGVAIGLIGVMIISWTEWDFRQTGIFFMAHVLMAVGAVLYYYRPKSQKFMGQ